VKACGLHNLAVHGATDFARHHVPYFSFHQTPEPLGEQHRFLLNILIPSLHIALLRILHTIKSQASLLPSRRRRALTPRELEVLTWVCEGKTSTEIASILGIAQSTVRNQIQSILVKLRVNTRAQAAAKAIKKGLVVPQQPDSQFGSF
jgi:DNA-binding CsgD family transcriptional regulator